MTINTLTNPNRALNEMPSQTTIEDGIAPPVLDRVYSNLGNAPLLDLLGKGYNHVLGLRQRKAPIAVNTLIKSSFTRNMCAFTSTLLDLHFRMCY